MTTRRNAGFTLIELLVVIAIIGILAALAYPSYQEQLSKSRRAEGKAKLLEMAQAMEKCKTLYGRYDSPGAAPFDCAAVTGMTGGNTVLSEEDFYTISAVAADLKAAEYTLRADPAIADAKCGFLTIDQAGVKDSESGDPEDCW